MSFYQEDFGNWGLADASLVLGKAQIFRMLESWGNQFASEATKKPFVMLDKESEMQ